LIPHLLSKEILPLSNADEKIIVTPSVKRFMKALRLLFVIKSGTIVAVTGPPGIGKTKAIDHVIAEQQPQSHTGRPAWLKVVVPPKATPPTVLIAILNALGIVPQKKAKALPGQVLEALTRYDIKLLIFDESDRLNDASFDMVRDIFDQTHRPMVLVGLPKLMNTIERYEQFDSRVAIEIEFKPLTLAELIASFLPFLEFGKWRFDPDKGDDREMAKYLWKPTSPSLRRLVNWINVANAIAEYDDLECVTLDTLKEAKELVRLTPVKSEVDTTPESHNSGWQEMLSETRKRAKK
jgi:MoxR-like ATPase